MHAKPPNSLSAWILLFAALTVLFGLNLLLGRLRQLPVTRSEWLILWVSLLGLVVTSVLWWVRSSLNRGQ